MHTHITFIDIFHNSLVCKPIIGIKYQRVLR